MMEKTGIERMISQKFKRPPPLNSDLCKSITAPYQYGLECGRNWAESASKEALQEAMGRETVRQQIKRYFEIYAAYLAHDEFGGSDEGYIGLFDIVSPHRDSTCNKEISTHFQYMVDMYPCFQGGSNDTTDSEVWYENLTIINIPPPAFRRYEEGWAKGVRMWMYFSQLRKIN